jgi:hypothetical protein
VLRKLLRKKGNSFQKASWTKSSKNTPRMYEVLRIIPELQNKQEVIYTGLIKKEIRKGITDKREKLNII